MGSSKSKEEPEATTNEQANHNIIQENSESGGFHIMELHMPTLHMGAGFLLYGVLFIFVLLGMYRCARSFWEAKQRAGAAGYGGGGALYVPQRVPHHVPQQVAAVQGDYNQCCVPRVRRDEAGRIVTVWPKHEWSDRIHDMEEGNGPSAPRSSIP